MKVLVTGYAGQLGWDTVHQLEARGIEARGVDIQDFSLTDAPAVMTGRQSKTARKFRIIKSHILDMNIKKGLS